MVLQGADEGAQPAGAANRDNGDEEQGWIRRRDKEENEGSNRAVLVISGFNVQRERPEVRGANHLCSHASQSCGADADDGDDWARRALRFVPATAAGAGTRCGSDCSDSSSSS